MKSNKVPAVTKIVPRIIFFEKFSLRKRIAIIAEKIGVMEVKGVTILMLVWYKPIYSRVSPIPKAINPLNRARIS